MKANVLYPFNIYRLSFLLSGKTYVFVFFIVLNILYFFKNKKVVLLELY